MVTDILIICLSNDNKKDLQNKVKIPKLFSKYFENRISRLNISNPSLKFPLNRNPSLKSTFNLSGNNTSLPLLTII